MLIRAWKRQLDPQATIYLSSLVLAVLRLNCTCFIEARKFCISRTFRASVFLPEHVFKPALLELKNLEFTQDIWRWQNYERWKFSIRKWKLIWAYPITRVKLVTMWLLSATIIGIDLAAYFAPANATICPFEASWNRIVSSDKPIDRLAHSRPRLPRIKAII